MNQAARKAPGLWDGGIGAESQEEAPFWSKSQAPFGPQCQPCALGTGFWVEWHMDQLGAFSISDHSQRLLAELSR